MASTSAVIAPVASVNIVQPRSPWLVFSQIVVVGIAFLLALTTARNADLWAHLASGRMVAAGFERYGIELHSAYWLADLGMYLLFTSFGSAALVFGKSFLLAATVAVFLERCPSWRTILGVLLACLTLGGWLPLSPVCFSYFFLALVATALNRESALGKATSFRELLRTHGWLLLCFVVWANCDVWCLLGIALVAIQMVCRRIVGQFGKEKSDDDSLRFLVLVLVASALCLLPWFASASDRELGRELANSESVLSPFRAAFFAQILRGELEGLVPTVAFWLLVGMGISSFIAVRRIQTVESRNRAIVLFISCTAFGVGSYLHPQIVPFFAIVLAAALAANFRALETASSSRIAIAAVRPQSGIERVRFAVQCLCCALAAFLILGAAWAGWLQSLPAERRNWTVEPDPSLVRAAEEVQRWYATGLIAKDRETAFFSSEAEDVFAWFAPQSLLASPAGKLSRAGIADFRDRILSKGHWTKSSAEHLDSKIGCVVLCDPNRSTFASALRSMQIPEEWTLAYLRGRVAVFARIGTGASSKPVDLAERAFGSKVADRAPESSGDAFEIATHWYDPFVRSRPPRSLDRDEAVTYLLYEEATRDRRMVDGANKFLAVLMASLAGSPSFDLPGWAIDPRASILTLAADKIRSPTEGPPPVAFGQFAAFLALTDVSANHYLAVRAARRGTAASPLDAGAYEALGEAYLHLLTDPLESSWSERFAPLRQLRLIQAAAAFHQAVVLDPTRAAAHMGLATVYLEEQSLDLAAIEFRAHERSAGLTGPQAKEATERTRALESAVDSARRSTEANAANLSPLDRSRLAGRNKLTGLALDTLLQSDVAEFGAEGIVEELNLLLSVGRVDDVRAWLSPEHRTSIGSLKYDWLVVQAAAAIGDYAGASALLESQIASSPRDETQLSAKDFGAVARIALQEIVLKRQSSVRISAALLASIVDGIAAAGRRVQFEYQSRTEGYLLLALLALEEGDIDSCTSSLDRVRKMWDELEKDGFRFPSSQRIILQQIASLIRR